MVGVACILRPIVIEGVHSTTPGHWVRGEEPGYLSVLGVSKKVEVWCELESVAGVVEDFGVQGDFLVGLKVRGVRGDEDVDPRFLLLAVRGLVGSRGLSEE